MSFMFTLTVWYYVLYGHAYSFSKLMIYHLTTENDDVAMTLIQTLELNVDPWDIKFDEQKNLWVLLPVEGSPLCVYQVDEDLTDQIQVLIII